MNQNILKNGLSNDDSENPSDKNPECNVLGNIPHIDVDRFIDGIYTLYCYKNGHHQRLATYNPMMIHLLYKTLCFLHLRFFIQMQSPFAQLWMDAYGNLMMEIR